MLSVIKISNTVLSWGTRKRSEDENSFQIFRTLEKIEEG
jgi:hypothetical protein